MNTRLQRKVQFLLTVLLILAQMASPLSVLARSVTMEARSSVASPVRSSPPPATMPSLSLEEARTNVMLSLQRLLNAPPDAPPEVTQAYQKALDDALARYAEIAQGSPENAPLPEDASTPSAGTGKPAPAISSQQSDDKDFMWYMQARPDASSAVTQTGEGASWLMFARPQADRQRFDETFSRLMKSSLKKPAPEPDSSAQAASPADPDSIWNRNLLGNNGWNSHPLAAGVEEENAPACPASASAVATVGWNANSVNNGDFEDCEGSPPYPCLRYWVEEPVDPNGYAVAGSIRGGVPEGCHGNIVAWANIKKKTSGPDPVARIHQTLNLSSIANAIDTGRVPYSFSANLGGFEDQEDYSVIHLYFLRADGTEISEDAWRGPSAAYPKDIARCEPRGGKGRVPKETRQVGIMVDFYNPDYHNNEVSVDAFVDDVAITLTAKSDLSIPDFSQSKDPIYATQPFTLALTVRNGGQGYADSAADLTISHLPPQATLISGSTSECSQSGGAGANVTCHWDKIAYGGTKQVYLRFQTGGGDVGTYSNIHAHVSGPWSDPDSDNNDRNFGSLTIQPSADLSIGADVPAAVTKKVGSDFSYDVRVVVTNTGPSKATGIVLTNTLPAQISSATSSVPCTHSGSNLVCNLGELAANHSKTVDLTLTVPKSVAEGTQLAFEAEVSGDGHDPGNHPNETGEKDTLVTYWDTKIGDPGLADTVYALAYAGGTLYAGTEHGVKEWDGSAWNALGLSRKAVYALAVVDNVLYAGGDFGVKERSGTAWVNVGSGGPTGTVHVLLGDSAGNLYAGGSNGVEKWDGSSWTSLGSLSGTAYALAIYRDKLYAGGSFVGGKYIKKWDGSSWVDMGADAPSGTVYALAASGYDLYAGGSFYGNLARYDGSHWYPGDPRGTVRALVADGSEIFAGGDFTNAGGKDNANYVARWNGVDAWTSLGKGTFTTVRALALSDDSVYVGGDFDRVDGSGVVSNKVGRWSSPTADLWLRKTGPTSVYAGEQVDYTLTIVNNGSASATHVALRDTLPEGFTFDHAYPDKCTASERVVTCTDLGTLNPRLSTTLHIYAIAASDAGRYRNVAVAGSRRPEISGGDDNISAVSTHVKRRSADLAVVKTGPPIARVDSEVTYHITVTNSGPDTAWGTVLTDTLPSGVTLVSAETDSNSCSHSGGKAVCNLHKILKDGEKHVTVVVSVPLTTTVGTVLHDSVVVRSNTDDPDTGNNTDSVSTTVEPYADLVLEKTAPSTVNAGEMLSYQITVTNKGPNSAEHVTVTDTLPSGVTFDRTQSDPRCSASGSTVTCGLSTLDKDDHPSFAIVADVPSTLGAGTKLVNTATVGSDAHEDNPGDETDSASTTVKTEADLDLTKSAPATVDAGRELTYTLTVVNDGPSKATGVVLTDTLPGGVSFVRSNPGAPTCTHSGGTVTCNLGDLDSAATSRVTVVVSVPQGTSGGTKLTNRAGVRSGVTDPNSSNDTASTVTTVETEADLALTKSAPASVMAGRQMTYTLTVVNSGPSRATGVRLTDNLPGQVSFVRSSPGGPTCSHSGEAHGGTVTCNLGDLDSAGSATVTIVVDVPGTTGVGTTLTNQASVSSGASDPNASNDTASASTTVRAEADLSLTKSAPASVNAGEQMSYRIQVTNHGPSQALNVRATDTLPGGVSFVRSIPGAPTCAHSGEAHGGTVTCNLGSLPNGETRSITVTVRARDDLSSGSTLLNSASVSSDSPDGTPGNDSDSASTTVHVDADLEAHKTAPSMVYISGSILYRLSVANHGPSRATGVTLTDHLPTGVSFAGASPGCTRAGSVVTCTVGALSSGATSGVYTITATPDPSLAEGTVLENHVTVSSGTPDSNGGNDEATASATVTRDPSNLQADLSLTKSAPATVPAGGTLVYTLRVMDEGALDASGVTLIDDLPAEAGFDSSASSQGSCTYDQPNHRVTCDLGDLANGASASVTISVTVAAVHVDEKIVNHASVSATEDDWHQDNNSASASTTVTPSADLSVAKDGPSTVDAGDQISYRISVTNRGPNYAPSVRLTDTLPSGVTFVSATPGQGTCNYDSANRLVLCDLNTLPSGYHVTVDLVVGVPSTTEAGTRLTDYASVGSGAHEENPGDEIASVTTTVETEADLDLSKSGSPDPVDAGGNLTYDLTIVNHGPSQALGVRITDTLPGQVSFVSVTPGGPTCTHSGEAQGGTVTCDLGILARNGIRNVSIVVRVRDDLADGSILHNSADVGSDVHDGTPGNDTDSVTTTVRTSADLEAHKAATARVYVRGHIDYELSVTNHGPSQARDVVLVDHLPVGTSFASASPGCAHSGSTVTCTVGALGVGETSGIYTVTVTMDPTLADGTVLQNGVTASASTSDPDGSNDTASSSTTVTTDPTDFQADLRVIKNAPNTIDAGSSLLYVIMVHNLGGLDATGVVVTDTLPPDVTVNASRTDPRCTWAGRAVTCTVGSLASQARQYISIVVDTSPWQAEGTVFRNVARAFADQDDWVQGNDSDDALTTVTLSSDLRLTKSAPASAKTGEFITYTLSVFNRGPSAASNVRIVDTLPRGVVFVSAASPDGACGASDGTVTCTIDRLGRWRTATATVIAMASDGGDQTNTATVTSDSPDPNVQDNSASASTNVEVIGPQTRTIGNVTVTANAFLDLGGNRVEALGDVKLGDHYRLEGGTATLDYSDDSIAGDGTLTLDQGGLALFDGGFTANGDTGLLTPAAGVEWMLQQVAGFEVQGDATISQVDLLSGQATGQATLHIHPSGMDTTSVADFTVGPGPTFGGTVQPFSLTLAGCSIDVTGAVLSDSGITVASSTLTLPARFGGGSTVFSSLTITPQSLYVGNGGGTFALPDIKYGAGTHLWITDLKATLVFAFGSFVMQLSGTVMVSIPGQIKSATVDDIFLDAQGNLSGSIDQLQLTVAGGPLDMSNLQINNDGLLASTAKWKLPNGASGSSTVYLTDFAITADGVDISSTPSLSLPDLKIGDKATFTNMKGRLVKTDNGLTLSVNGTLRLSLPQNSQSVKFTAQINTKGEFQGSLDQITLNLANFTLKLTKVSFDNKGLSVSKGTLTLPDAMGGIQAIVTDVKIDENGLSIGGGGVGIPLPDFDMGKGAFTVTNSMLTFEIGSDHTFKVTISGTIQLKVKSLNASATASISVDSLGNISGSVQSFSITVAGLGLAIEKAEITDEGFFAAKAAFQVPGSWGGLTAEVYNIRIGSNGISIGGGKFKLPDIKVGKVTLGGLEGWFKESDGGYEIGAGGKFIIPGLGGGESCGISVHVTFYVDASGQTVARIEPVEPPSPEPQATPTLDDIAAAGNMHPANFTPDDVDEIEGFALKNVSVALEGCKIPIGDTGLYLSRVSGSLTLNHGTTRIDLGVTIIGGPELFGVSAISGDVDFGLQFNPFEMDLSGAISLFSIFKMAEMSATVRENFFNATLHIVQFWPPIEGDASLTIWTTDGFHLVGRATLTLGFDKGALGEACMPVVEWPCVDLPPFDLRLAEIGAEFGEFISDDGTVWGFKAWVTIGIYALDLTVPVGVYIDAGGHIHVGNVDQYHTVTPPSVSRARRLWKSVQNGERTLSALSAGDRDLLQSITFDQDDVYVSVPVAAPTDLMILFSHETDRPSISLIRPDGLEITPDNAPDNVGFHEDRITGKDSSGNDRTATQVMVIVKSARPGTWQVKLGGPMGEEDQYVLQVNGIDPEPVLRDLSAVSTGPTSAEFGWSLVSNEITTTLNIYATTGPITATQTVTDANGVPRQVTVPVFTGAPIATAVPTPLDGSPGSIALDLSNLETGVYHIWFDANDGRNPPIRAYAPGTIEIVQPWQPSWTSDVRVESGYRRLTVRWDRSPNPDTDSYRLRVSDLPGGISAQGVQLAARALNTPPEIEVGDILSTTLYNLAPGHPYYISVLAVDEDTGQVSQSEEIAAVPEGAPFDLSADTGAVTVAGGGEAVVTVRATTGLDPYPTTVSLYQGTHPDGITLSPETGLITPTVAGAPVQVVIRATKGVPGGTYTVDLDASGGGVKRTLPLRVTVLEPGFDLTANPAAVTLGDGETTRIDITAGSVNGWDGSAQIGLDYGSFPDWLLYDLTDSILPAGGSVTLILTDTKRLANGHYTLRLTGRDGARTGHLEIPLTVEKPGFDLSTPRVRKVALYGETITYTVDLSGYLWQEPVELSLAHPISGTTLGFVSAPGSVPTDTISVTVPARVYLVADVTSDTGEGTYRIDVQADSSGKQESTPLEMVVQSEATSADLGVSQPTIVDAVAGMSYVYTVTVTNYGPLTATNVIVTDTLPAEHVTLVDATPSQGICTPAGAVVTCDLGDLARDGDATVSVELFVDPSTPSGTLLTNLAEAGTAEKETALLDNRHAGHASVETQANLSVVKSDAPDPVAAGADLQYHLTVVNYGPSDARSVTVRDALPQQVTFVSATADQGTCGASGGTVTCDLGTLSADHTAEVTIHATVKSDAQGRISNTAEVSSAEADPVPDDNTDTEETVVSRSADLSLSVSASPNPVAAGRSLTYSFLVANHGPSDATGVTLTDVLPAGVTFVSASPSGACSEAGGTVTCDLGDVASGEGVLATVIVALAPDAGGTLVSTAEVHGTSDDPRPEDNSGTFVAAVTALADLYLRMDDSPDPATAGGSLTYTLIVGNDGPSYARSVTVQDLLPDGVSFVSASAGQGGCTESDGVVTCDLGDVAPGANVTVVLTVSLDVTLGGRRIRNVGRVSAVTEDTNAGNDSASAVTTVGVGAVLRYFLPLAGR